MPNTQDVLEQQTQESVQELEQTKSEIFEIITEKGRESTIFVNAVNFKDFNYEWNDEIEKYQTSRIQNLLDKLNHTDMDLYFISYEKILTKKIRLYDIDLNGYALFSWANRSGVQSLWMTPKMVFSESKRLKQLLLLRKKQL